MMEREKTLESIILRPSHFPVTASWPQPPSQPWCRTGLNPLKGVAAALEQGLEGSKGPSERPLGPLDPDFSTPTPTPSH